jgi:hypothetical protein
VAFQPPTAKRNAVNEEEAISADQRDLGLAGALATSSKCSQVQSLAWGGSKPAHVIDNSLTFSPHGRRCSRRCRGSFWIAFGQASWIPLLTESQLKQRWVFRPRMAVSFHSFS